MGNNALYENLIKIISREIKKALYEYEEFNSLKIYDSNNSDDADFISNNKKMLWNFFNDGYKAANLNTFSNSCYDARSLKKNASILKIAYIKDNNADVMIAASIYSAHQQGNKCVGITATTDEKYRAIGKDAVKYIIKQDIGLYANFYWGVFSDAVKHYYEKFGGVLIPNDYVEEFIPNAIPSKNSEYDISIILRDGTEVKKVIYGFNSKETYDKIMALEDTRVTNAISKIKEHYNVSDNTDITDVKESHEYINPRYYVDIINFFYDNRNLGYTDFTPTSKQYLIDARNKLKDYISTTTDIMSNNQKRYYLLAIENANDVLDTSTLMQLHEFQ